jgi:DNA primase
MQEQHFDDARAHIQGCLETIDRKRTEAMLRDLITQLKTAEREGRIEDVRVLNGRVNEMRLQKAGRPLGVLSLVKGVSKE